MGPLLEAERAALAASEHPNPAPPLELHAPGALEARRAAEGEAALSHAVNRALCKSATLSPNPTRPPTPLTSPARSPLGARFAEPDWALRGETGGGADADGPADAGSQGHGTRGVGPGSRRGGSARERSARHAKRARQEPSPPAEPADTAELPANYNGRCPPASRWRLLDLHWASGHVEAAVLLAVCVQQSAHHEGAHMLSGAASLETE